MVRRKAIQTPAQRPIGRPRPALRASEIDLLIAIEGRPPAAVHATAQRFCLSQAALRSWIRRLKKRNLLRTVAIVDRTRQRPTVESVAYIKVDWSHPAAMDLEGALRTDPAVTEAALTLGPFDYTAFVAHDDHHAAAAWSRWLRSQPCVSWCRVNRMQTQFKTFAFAAALLKPAGAE